MPITLDGSNGITTPMYNGSITANAVTPSVNMKNRIINGAMVIDQRNAGASVNSAAGGNFSVDRFTSYASGGGVYTTQQSSDVPTGSGFVNSIVATVTTTDSPTGSDYYLIVQSIEGFNVADLGWGTASAKTVTLSFWVKSSIAGTYTAAFRNNALNRSYRASYTISTTNTWEQKSITVAGDTTGTWLKTNGTGIQLGFTLGAGSDFIDTANTWSANDDFAATGQTQWISTNGATFYITGVQLEVGSTATSFDYRPYGTELALCQRYFSFVGYNIWSGNVSITGNYYATYAFKISMRTAPTVVYYGGGASNFATSGTLQNQVTTEEVSYYRVASGTGTGYFIENMTFSAEL
jgi:hypothetical protein